MTNFGWWAELAAVRGEFMCAVCFEGFPASQAWQDAEGARWDICPTCGAVEAACVWRFPLSRATIQRDAAQ